MSDNYISSKTNLLTHNTSWTGIWLLDQVGNIPYVKIDKLVTVVIPTLNAPANAIQQITNVTVLPAELRPTNTIYFHVLILDDPINQNTVTSATMRIDSGGIITISGKLALATKFAGTAVNGNSGLNSISVSYVVN